MYYTERSQPPLLSQMVELYYNRTGDVDFLQRMLPALVTEYDFWISNRTLVTEALAQYKAPTTSPR